METFTKPTKPQRRQSSLGPPAQMSTVYADDHIMAAVEDNTGQLLQRTARTTLQAIHSVSATVSYELARGQGPHFGEETAQRERTMGHPKGDLGVHTGRYRPNSPTPNGSGGRPHQGSPCHLAQNTGPNQTFVVHRRTLTTRSADPTGCSRRLLHDVVQRAQGIASVYWSRSTWGSQACSPRCRQRHP